MGGVIGSGAEGVAESVTVPPPPLVAPRDRDGRQQGWPLPLGAGWLGWLAWNSVSRDRFKMSLCGTQDHSSGPKPSQSTRYSSQPPRLRESRMVCTLWMDPSSDSTGGGGQQHQILRKKRPEN